MMRGVVQSGVWVLRTGGVRVGASALSRAARVYSGVSGEVEVLIGVRWRCGAVAGLCGVAGVGGMSKRILDNKRIW